MTDVYELTAGKSMRSAQSAIDAAIREAEQLRKTLRRKLSLQVQSSEERAVTRATALSWFKNHREVITSVVDDQNVTEVDALYKAILAASERKTIRSKYFGNLRIIKRLLVETRSRNMEKLARSTSRHTPDQPPIFAPLIPDEQMQTILIARWNESVACIMADAPLAATVMMGGLLEALLLARVNSEGNKESVFRAAHAPKDKDAGKTLPLNKWTLRHYIDVAHELHWISQTARDVGEVLGDYRNYIHPYKQLSRGVTLKRADAEILWEVCKSLTKQLLASPLKA